MMTFKELLNKADPTAKRPERLLALDPGETTGYAIFHNCELVEASSFETYKEGQINWQNLIEHVGAVAYDEVVCENYRIYSHKLSRHSFSEVPTLRIIGGIELLCHQEDMSIHYQMAATVKGFMTDKKLQEWGFFGTNKHARDAIRHGAYHLLFKNRRK